METTIAIIIFLLLIAFYFGFRCGAYFILKNIIPIIRLMLNKKIALVRKRAIDSNEELPIIRRRRN
jgi:hypothetical protein